MDATKYDHFNITVQILAPFIQSKKKEATWSIKT